MAVKKVVETQKQSVNTLIYCGPSLAGGVLQQYAMFKNGLPKHLDVHIEKCPAIKELFVTPHKLAEIRNKLSVQGTRENMLFNQVLEYVGRDR